LTRADDENLDLFVRHRHLHHFQTDLHVGSMIQPCTASVQLINSMNCIRKFDDGRGVDVVQPVGSHAGGVDGMCPQA
jgi:hypothetical protein